LIEPEYRARQHRLAAPGLADDADALAFGDGETDPVEDLDRTVIAGENEAKILDF
jgi:hypothetical protein